MSGTGLQTDAARHTTLKLLCAAQLLIFMTYPLRTTDMGLMQLAQAASLTLVTIIAQRERHSTGLPSSALTRLTFLGTLLLRGSALTLIISASQVLTIPGLMLLATLYYREFAKREPKTSP